MKFDCPHCGKSITVNVTTTIKTEDVVFREGVDAMNIRRTPPRQEPSKPNPDRPVAR